MTGAGVRPGNRTRLTGPARTGMPPKSGIPFRAATATGRTAGAEQYPGKQRSPGKKNAEGRAFHAAGIGSMAFFLTYRPPMATLGEHIRQSNAYKWWILGMIMLGTFMAVLDVTVVNVGLPAIMSAFGIGISTAEWVITAYMITMTVMLPSAGWFADRFGNKRIYILGLALFTLGSWLCGKAPGDLFLIGARALQGVGSGIIQSLGLAIVTREFRPEQLGLALGLWAMAAAASISFGPLLGGYLVDAYSWHRIFDVNVPVGSVRHPALGLYPERMEKPGAAPVRLAGIRGHRALHAAGDLCAGAGQLADQPRRLGLAHGDRLFRRGGRGARLLRPHGAAQPGAAAAAAPARGAQLRGFDGRADALLDRYAGRHLPAAALHAARAGLHGADGRERIPARGAHTRSAVGRIGLPHALCQTPAARGGGHPAAGDELLAGQPFHAPHHPPAHPLRALHPRAGHGAHVRPAELLFSLRNLTQHDMAAAAGISNSIKQLAGSVGIAILTAVYSARTAFHAAHETVSASQTYVEGVTDALGVVTWLTLAAGLPLLWVFRKKRKKTPAGNPGAAGEAGES